MRTNVNDSGQAARNLYRFRIFDIACRHTRRTAQPPRRGPPWAMHLHSGRAVGAAGSRSHRVNSIGPRGRKSVIFRAINRRYCDASFGRCFQWKSDCGHRCDTITLVLVDAIGCTCDRANIGCIRHIAPRR